MKEITVEELKKKFDNHEDFQIIDVREPFEYEVSNLGAENIPLAGVLIEADKISKDKPVIIQCRSGARSAAAIMQLENQFGYTNLYNLKGDIMDWADLDGPFLTKNNPYRFPRFEEGRWVLETSPGLGLSVPQKTNDSFG